MITNLLLDILTALCNFFVATLPPFSITLPGSIVQFAQWLMGFNNMFPMSEILVISALSANIVTIVTGVRWTKQVIDWIVGIIP